MIGSLSFKREPKDTGLSAVANPVPNVQIKLDRKQVGYLSAPNWRSQDGLWRIQLAIKDPKEKSGWKWIYLKYKPKDEEDGRKFMSSNWMRICQMYELHQLED